MANPASPTKPESTKEVDDEDDTPEYQEMIMFYVSLQKKEIKKKYFL